MVQEMSLLNLKLDTVLDELRNRRQANIELPDRQNIEEFYSKIPLNNETDMADLERWLLATQNYKVALAEMSRIGGISMPQTVRKILCRTMTNEVANTFSWDGMKQKRPFKNQMLAKVLLDAVKLCYKEETESNIINCTKVWLVKAKERMKHKNKVPNPIEEEENPNN